MHFKKSIAIVLILFSSLFALKAQKKENKIVEIKETKEIINPFSQSLTYMLPKTSFKIDIITEKTIKKTGPYYRYSKRFLNLSEVITEDSEEWTIKKVLITTFGTPDPEKRYSIIASNNTSANQISLNPDGVLLGINQPQTIAKHPIQESEKASIPSINDINFDNISLHQDLLFKTSTAAMAQEAASMIYKLRNNRIDLLSGDLENLPPDGEAYKAVIFELTKQEKEFISLFAGKTIKHTEKQSFIITPDPLSSYNNSVICRFQKQKGIVDAMDISGTPIYFNLDIISSPKLINKEEEEPKHKPKEGLFYYLPGTTKVTILDKNKELTSEEFKLAQYGKIVSMPASILKDENISVKISPITGNLISIQKNK